MAINLDHGGNSKTVPITLIWPNMNPKSKLFLERDNLTFSHPKTTHTDANLHYPPSALDVCRHHTNTTQA